jgi:hypothetical protein
MQENPRTIILTEAGNLAGTEEVPGKAGSHSGKVELLRLPPGTVTNVEYLHLLLFLQYTVYDAIHVRLMAVEQVPQFAFGARDRTPVWMFLQAEDVILESAVPFQRRFGGLGVNSREEFGQVAFSP